MNKKRRTKIINLFTKIILVLLFIYIIYNQVFVNQDIDKLADEFMLSINNSNPLLLVLVFVLMMINWSFEALKWKSLMSKFEDTSFLKAIQTILTGVTSGIITPAKVGEYFGRVLLVEPKNNWKAIWATFISSIAQNIATIFFGSIGLFFYLKKYYNIEGVILNSTFYLGIILVVVLVFIYFNLDLALKIIRRLGLQKIADKIVSKDEKILDFVNRQILNKVLIFSILRYMVFALQYYILLIYFGVNGDVLVMFSAIATVFIIQSSIPLPPITNIFARGEIAILVFSHFTNNEIMILSSTFSLWLINLLIPAIIGLIIIFRINVAKSLGYD